MSLPANLVTIHPYFKIHAGKEAEAAAVQRKFIERTRSETKCLFYQFTQNGDIVFCREGYQGAEGALAHMNSVADILAEMLEVADLLRLEIHGPEEELNLIRQSANPANVDWFHLRRGL